jgi:DNA-binding MarR family transcriptional regulator
MSQRSLFCLLPPAILSDGVLTSAALRLWLLLAARQGAEDSATVPLHDLERQCGLARFTVTRRLRQLAKRGYLEYRYLPGGVLRYNVSTDVEVVE